jgi:5-methylcytosine-specific restriction endonuclease McrA
MEIKLAVPAKKKPRTCIGCNVVFPPEEFVIQTPKRRYTLNPAKCSGCRKPTPPKLLLSLAVSNSKQRAKALGVVNTLTTRQWVGILDACDGFCFYCRVQVGREKLCLDHFTPMNSGGANSAENVVPACWLCNSRKGLRLPSAELLSYLRIVGSGFHFCLDHGTLDAVRLLHERFGVYASAVFKSAVQALAASITSSQEE